MFARHTVTVTPKVDSGSKDRYNQPVMVDGPPVVVSCDVQPISTSEPLSRVDDLVRTIYRVAGRGQWPGGATAKVTWNGRDFDQLGDTTVYSMSPRTAHYEVLITSKGSAT